MSFFGPGGTGRNIAGLLGDVLLQQGGHQAAFGPAMQQRQKMQFEEQQRQRARVEGMEDFKTKEQYQRDNQAPYIPDAEKQAKYYESIGDINTAKDIRDRVGLIPVQRLNPTTQDVETVMVRPGLLTDGGSTDANLPRISTPAEAAALPPGTPFIAPDGSRRRTPGGAAPSNGPGMFPRPY